MSQLRRRRFHVTATILVVTLAAGPAALASASGGAPADPTPGGAGIEILPDLPEPELAQFTPGRSNVVTPAAPPATDMETPPSERAAGTYTCPGFSSIDDANPLSNLYRDVYAWGPFAPYRVGNGSGNINWRLDPYRNPSWYMWFHSLRWLGQGIVAAGAGDRDALARVTAIVRDWVRDNPYSWKGDIGAYESTMHRTNVIICTRQAVLAGLGTSTLPSAYTWLDSTLNDHARFLTAHWSGAWNHGTDESIALFGVGCTLNRADYKRTAQQRLAAGITTAVDKQGSTNEQATSYAQFNYGLWGRAATVLQQCGGDPGSTIQQRRALMATWLAMATNSLGRYHQIGDSEVMRTHPYPGTPMQYAGSLGTAGSPPPSRLRIYSAGYVFGRTGWGVTRPFTQESSYAIRFGPPRAVHGHSDHLGITYTSRGRDILVDGGHAGYENDVWRAWARGSFAHSSLTTPMSTDRLPSTKLTRYVLRSSAEFYEFTDVPATGVSRTRGVLVMNGPDLIVCLDRAFSVTAQHFQTLWHLPSDQRATVYSRTTAVAIRPGDTTRTIVFQVPYRQTLPAGATLVKQGRYSPIQGWHFPDIFTRKPAPTIMMARSGTSASILSFVVPVPATGSVTYTTGWSGSTFVVNLNVAGKRTSIGVTPGGSLFRRS